MSARPILLIAGALVAGAAVSLLVLRVGEEDADVGDEGAVKRRPSIASAIPERRASSGKAAKSPKGDSARRVTVVETATSAGGAEDVDESELTGVQKRVFDELQTALDNEDLRSVRKALAKFKARASEGGLEGSVPVCLRSKAVEALKWFGKRAAVDVMEYMADTNEDVASDASDAFDSALRDFDMSDFERSTLVKASLQAINDADQVDTILSHLNDMRNSVKVQTITEILSSGTETARTKMQEQMGDFTDSEVTTIEQLETWLAENPDSEDDAASYGGDTKSDGR